MPEWKDKGYDSYMEIAGYFRCEVTHNPNGKWTARCFTLDQKYFGPIGTGRVSGPPFWELGIFRTKEAAQEAAEDMLHDYGRAARGEWSRTNTPQPITPVDVQSFFDKEKYLKITCEGTINRMRELRVSSLNCHSSVLLSGARLYDGKDAFWRETLQGMWNVIEFHTKREKEKTVEGS